MGHDSWVLVVVKKIVSLLLPISLKKRFIDLFVKNVISTKKTPFNFWICIAFAVFYDGLWLYFAEAVFGVLWFCG